MKPRSWRAAFAGEGRIAPQIVLNGLAVIAAKSKGLLLILLVAGTAGVDGFGVWVQALVVVALGVMLGGLGLPNALVRFYAREDTDARGRIVWTSLTLVLLASTMIAAAVVMLAPVLADVVGRGARDQLLFGVAAVLIPLVAARTLLLNLARAQDRLAFFSSASAAIELLDLLFIASVLLSGAGVAAALGASAAANAVAVTALFAFFRRDLGRPRAMGPGPLLRYSLPIVPTQLSDEALARADRLIVGGFLGPAAVGVYAALYTLASVPNIANTAFTNVLFPRLVRVGGAAAAALVGRSSRLFALLTALQVPLLALAAAPIVGVLLRESQPRATSAAVVALAGLGVLFWGVARITSLHLYLRNRTGLVLAVWGGAAVFNVLLNLALVPALGLVGAALASCIAYGVVLVLQLYLTREARRATSHDPAVPLHWAR